MTAAEDYIRLDPVETAIGWPLERHARSRAALASRPGMHGADPGAGHAASATRGSARQALERSLTQSLSSATTYVSFSGGRDSSAVLAVAAHVARREGLPLPVPVTVVYPGVADTDEADWQELVLDHLGITERVVVRVDGEQTLLSEHARASLERRGPLWPSALHTYDVFVELLSGGHLLTGEGGDEVLEARRVTPVSLLAHERVRPSRGLLVAAAWAVMPNVLRARKIRAMSASDGEFPWLRGPAERARVLADVALAVTPLRWDSATLDLLTRRPAAVLEHNYARFAREHDVTVRHPLREPAFVRALAAEGGGWGFRGRTTMMRHLFSDVLPDRVLSRTTKATFNLVRFGAAEREFASRWDGSGLDPNLVDVDALRAHWLSDRPFGVTGGLMHAAWLAGRPSPRP